MPEPRSREARARAELALVRLLHELEDDSHSLVVLGGLVPEMLTGKDTSAPPHLGTTDVDMLLITHLTPGADLGEVERSLDRMGFASHGNEDGWRWHGPVDGPQVTLEFLCDLPDQREGEIIRPQGCSRLAAANLRGTGHVANSFVELDLIGTLADGTEVTIPARFADLRGYLLSKCVAVRTRAAAKDYYDFAYVIQHNDAGGPEQAAAEILAESHHEELAGLRTTFREVRERFVTTSSIGPRAYAEQALEIQPDASEAALRADAIDVVQRFFTALNGP